MPTSSFAPRAINLDEALDRPEGSFSRHEEGNLTKKGRARVPITWEEARAMMEYDLLARRDRKKLRPEWFRGTDPRIHCEREVPLDIQAAFDAAMLQLEQVAGARESVFVHWHPLLHRWAVWQQLPTGKCEVVDLIEKAWKPGELPSDLQGPVWEYLRGRIGEYRRPTFADFAKLLDVWYLAHTDTEIEQWFAAPEIEAEQDAERAMRDEERDITHYYGLALHRFEDNHGRRNYQTHSEPLPEGELKVKTQEYQRAGYKVRVAAGSEMDLRLAAEEQAKAHARADAIDKLEDSQRASLRERAQASRAERERL